MAVLEICIAKREKMCDCFKQNGEFSFEVFYRVTIVSGNLVAVHINLFAVL